MAYPSLTTSRPPVGAWSSPPTFLARLRPVCRDDPFALKAAHLSLPAPLWGRPRKTPEEATVKRGSHLSLL